MDYIKKNPHASTTTDDDYEPETEVISFKISA